MAWVEKHWVRKPTLSEKNICKRKTIASIVIFLMALAFTLWLYKPGITHKTEGMSGDLLLFLIAICVYSFMSFIDGGFVLLDDKICLVGKEDCSLKDKWYHYFLPHSPGTFSIWVFPAIFLICTIIKLPYIAIVTL